MGFLFSGLTPTDPYWPVWVEMRRRRKVGRRAFFIGMCFFIFAGIVASLISGVVQVIVMITAALGTMIICNAGIHYGKSSPCPRCGQPFNLAGNWPFVWSWMFPDNCLHCGLPEYAPHGDF